MLLFLAYLFLFVYFFLFFFFFVFFSPVNQGSGGIILMFWSWGKNLKAKKGEKEIFEECALMIVPESNIWYKNTLFNYFDSNFTIFILYGVENQGILLLAEEENQRHGEEEIKVGRLYQGSFRPQISLLFHEISCLAPQTLSFRPQSALPSL